MALLGGGGSQSKGSGALSGAASGASVGTSILPGWGTAIGAVVGAVAGLFSSKGKGYAVGAGYEVQGVATAQGLQGSVTGISKSPGGETYRISEAQGAYGERAELDKTIREAWVALGLPTDLQIPFNYQSPYSPELYTIAKQGLSAARNALGGGGLSTMDAPTIDAANPSGMPTPTQTPTPGSAPEASPTLALMALQNDKGLWLALAAVAAMVLMK